MHTGDDASNETEPADRNDAAPSHGARPPETDEAFVALGSNAGARAAALQGAVRAMRAHEAVRAVRASPVYETEAHTLRPEEEHPAYLNAVVQLRTDLPPEALLAWAWDLEASAGRDRAAEAGRWQPRPLDVDLLVVGAARHASPRLTLPHPRLGERAFVLAPWADVAPNLRVPAPFGKTTSALLVACPDRSAIRRTTWTLD